MHSAIYEGWVRHRRYRPMDHRFQYRLFMMYLDLDELPTVFNGRWLWSVDGFGLARLRRHDHLKGVAGPSLPLATATRDFVESRTGRRPTGPIRLLTHLEYFGYRFNPVSFYYCFDASDTYVETVIAEINNTPWGEQHCYVLGETENVGSAHARRFQFAKEFHVSPFMGMEIEYDWRVRTPGTAIAIHMNNFERGSRTFDATMLLKRREITGVSLAGVLTKFPLMTARVMGAIYYQAFKLWWKRCPYVPHPRAKPLART
ncbi:MAG: DUF1365 domain-containing protein [Phycisphaerae bacterium]